MKRSDFKKLMKECIKEAIVEEGVLSTVISEVVKGLRVQRHFQKVAIQIQLLARILHYRESKPATRAWISHLS